MSPVRSATGADDDPSSRRRPFHSPSRSHVQPPPLPVPRSATALRKRPRTDVRSAWSPASSESRLNRPAFSFDQFSVLADRQGGSHRLRRSRRAVAAEGAGRGGTHERPESRLRGTEHVVRLAAPPRDRPLNPRGGGMASAMTAMNESRLRVRATTVRNRVIQDEFDLVRAGGESSPRNPLGGDDSSPPRVRTEMYTTTTTTTTTTTRTREGTRPAATKAQIAFAVDLGINPDGKGLVELGAEIEQARATRAELRDAAKARPAAVRDGRQQLSPIEQRRLAEAQRWGSRYSERSSEDPLPTETEAEAAERLRRGLENAEAKGYRRDRRRSGRPDRTRRTPHLVSRLGADRRPYPNSDDMTCLRACHAN